MKGFKLTTAAGVVIRFAYDPDAPLTTAAFHKLLPFTRVLMHARTSGQEIWTDQAPPIDVIQENASVFTQPGEVVYGPTNATRTKTRDCMGIYYGEGKGLDSCNIFAQVWEEDKALLTTLGADIWRRGEQSLLFETLA